MRVLFVPNLLAWNLADLKPSGSSPASAFESPHLAKDTLPVGGERIIFRHNILLGNEVGWLVDDEQWCLIEDERAYSNSLRSEDTQAFAWR